MPLVNLTLIAWKWEKTKHKFDAHERTRFKKWVVCILILYFVILFVPIPFGEADELGLFLFYFFILFAMSSIGWAMAFSTLFKEPTEK